MDETLEDFKKEAKDKNVTLFNEIAGLLSEEIIHAKRPQSLNNLTDVINFAFPHRKPLIFSI